MSREIRIDRRQFIATHAAAGACLTMPVVLRSAGHSVSRGAHSAPFVVNAWELIAAHHITPHAAIKDAAPGLRQPQDQYSVVTP